MAFALQPVIGILALTVIAIIFSEDRRANKMRLIATGVGIQFVFALLLLKVPFIKETVALINQGVLALQKASEGQQEPTVLIRAAANATHQLVITGMQAARQVGIARVHFATQASE